MTAIDGREAEAERMREALEQIEQWIAAYPETVFRPVSPDQMQRAGRVLREFGISMDAMHAEWARHLLDGIHEIVRSALYPEAAAVAKAAGDVAARPPRDIEVTHE